MNRFNVNESKRGGWEPRIMCDGVDTGSYLAYNSNVIKG